MIWSLAAALGMALAYGVATVLQAVAAKRGTGLAVIRDPLAIGGFLLDGVAWLLSLVALARLPLFVVQAIQAAQLVVIVALAHFVLGAVVRRIETVAICAVMLALVVLALAAGDQPATAAPHGFDTAMIVVSVALIVAALLSYAKAPSWWLAVLAGIGYSLTALAARAAQGHGGWDGFIGALGVAILVGGAVAITCYLRALEGQVGTTAAVVVVLEVTVPGGVGVAVLGDGIRSGWAPTVIAAVVVAIAGCVTLAVSPANSEVESGGEHAAEPH